MAVRLWVPDDPGQNRLWGIPFLGIVARVIISIPQLLILMALGIVMYLLILVAWIPVLVMGRQATWLTGVFRLIGIFQARTALYVSLATRAYPGFGGPDHPVRVEVDDDSGQNRLWGIPFVGVLVRAILCIPHGLVLWVLGLGVGLLSVVSWVPILVNGRQAPLVTRFIAATYGYGLRVAAYLVLVTGDYPPFRLDGLTATAPGVEPAPAVGGAGTAG